VLLGLVQAVYRSQGLALVHLAYVSLPVHQERCQITKCSVSDGHLEAPEAWGDVRVQIAFTMYGGSNWNSFTVAFTRCNSASQLKFSTREQLGRLPIVSRLLLALSKQCILKHSVIGRERESTTTLKKCQKINLKSANTHSYVLRLCSSQLCKQVLSALVERPYQQQVAFDLVREARYGVQEFLNMCHLRSILRCG
jgi:hypothetical protein